MRICSPSSPAYLRPGTSGVGAFLGTPAPHSYTTWVQELRGAAFPNLT